MEIKIQSTKLLKPSKSTHESQRNYKLSFLDQLAPSSYINLIFYYRASDKVDFSDRCGLLVNSLSEVLTLFYPLAGRITEDGLVVECRDQGIKYLETRVSTRLDAYLKQCPKIDQFRQLISAPDKVTNTLVSIQINVFDCGSLVIGVSASHKVTDAYNLVRFINEWASKNRTGASNGAFAASFDNLATLFPPKEIMASLKYSSSRPITIDHETKIVTKMFTFNGSTISKLREKAGSLNHKHSRVPMVAALIWKALISVDQVKNGSLRDCLLAPAMNLRGKVGSLVSDSAFGNVWAPYPIRYLQNKMQSKFVDLVTLIEGITRNVIMQLRKASCEEIGTQAMEGYAKVNEELKQNKFCIFSSWCRFPIYEADFGWGKPIWARAAGSLGERVILMDDKDGKGIEAWVSLKEKDMYVFEQDQDILVFTS